MDLKNITPSYSSARDWSALLMMYAIVIFAGWVIKENLTAPERPLCPPPTMEKSK